MSSERQLEKLSAVYAEKSDAELLALHEQSDGLTELAQKALAGVMRERGLGALDARGSSAAEPPQAADGVGGEDAVAGGEVLAYLFHDAFEARAAMRCMTEAGIAHRVLDWHVVEPEREVSFTGVDLGLVVGREDAQRTMAVLKEKLGLFPAGDAVVAGGGEDGLAVLSMFERADALLAARALGEAGVTYLWRDGSDESAGLPDEETVAIEVRPAEMERAMKVVEEALS